MAGEALSLRAAGYVLLAGTLDSSLTAAVLDEATTVSTTARRVVGDYYRINGDRSLSSPRRLRAAAAGAVLDSVHRDTRRVAQLSSILGEPAVPTRSSYIYYDPGDYIGLHKDAASCRVTLITSLAGPLGPLVIHPPLTTLPPEELLRVSQAHSGMPPGGVRVIVPAGGRFLMLLGSKIPHHRPATLDACAIATLCYG